MAYETNREIIEDLHAFIERAIATGFDDWNNLAEDAIESCAYELEDTSELEPVAENMVQRAVASQLARQAEWPEVTDCDRLDQAFAELEQAGIVARQNFTCCGT